MSGKARLSASVDTDLLEAAERAAATGQVATVSAWVNDAMRLKLERDGRLHALAEFIADYEAEQGEITKAEMARAGREAKRRAVAVRGTRAGERRRKYGRTRSRGSGVGRWTPHRPGGRLSTWGSMVVG